MTTIALRCLGFALPTLLLATGIHVQRDPSWGSWLDGLLSGAWFAGLAALGAAGAGWRSGRCEVAAVPPRPLALGAIGGGLTWLVLWAAWKIPGATRLEPQAFAVNCAAFFLAGVLLARRPLSRPPGRRFAGHPMEG